jgi:hypothetical protein
VLELWRRAGRAEAAGDPDGAAAVSYDFFDFQRRIERVHRMSARARVELQIIETQNAMAQAHADANEVLRQARRQPRPTMTLKKDPIP